jgi:EmrB/QacA subfamily drug resistance transporter
MLKYEMGAMTKRQRLVLVVSVLAAFVPFMDSAIVNVALPSIQHSLGGGLSAQQWVVDAYLLTLGSLILVAGSIADLFGRKRVLSTGLLGFGAASLLCALAPNDQTLIIARAIQGVAGALLVPSSLAIIIATFKDSAESKAIGRWTAWTSIAFVIGPLMGGVILSFASWRWIFAINVVPIVITLSLLQKLQFDEPKNSGVRVDYLGALLCALGLGASVFALIEQPQYGWASPEIYLPLAAGIVLFFGFLFYEKRIAHPMLPLNLFRNHNFAFGNLATLAIYAGLSVATFLLVLFLQQVGGYSPLLAGLSLLPISIMSFFLAPRFGALAGKYGPRLLMTFGPLTAGCGFLLMLRVGAHVNYWTDLFPAIIVFALGLTMTVAPLTAAVLGDVATAQAGIASAINNAVARVTGLVSIAVVGAVVATRFGVAALRNLSCRDLSTSVLTAVKQHSLVIVPPSPYTHDGQFVSALKDAAVQAFHSGAVAIACLMIVGGVVSFVGIRNPSKSLKPKSR